MERNIATRVLMVFIIILSIPFVNNKVFAQSDSSTPTDFPVPTGNANQLFYLQRTQNTNTVVYELNYKNGALNKSHPIHAYWIDYANGGKHQELSDVEKKFAYGIKVLKADISDFEFNVVAYPKVILKLLADEDKHYHVYVTLAEKELVLDRIYINMKDDGTLFKPDITDIELTATEPSTGKKFVEKTAVK